MEKEVAVATITGTTSVYALLADPVHHVKTPEMLNTRLAEAGIDTVVVPLHVGPEDLAGLVDGLRSWRNLTGFGVTIPHKERMADLVEERTDAASRCGATNVVRRTPQGHLVGAQLDGAGFGNSLAESGFRPEGARVLVIGAGGTAKAIVYELAERGVTELVIVNRTIRRAEALADEVTGAFPGVRAAAATREPAGDFDLIVNASSLGMHDGDPLPVNPSLLRGSVVVAEVVMSPAVTPLLAAAQEARCPVLPGRLMLEAQMAATIEFLQLRPSDLQAHIPAVPMSDVAGGA